MSLKQFYYKRNRIQQLKGFYYTVQTGSISKAAKKMALTQAAVTLQIQSLERDLGTKIFKRDNQKLVLTEEGKVLYSQAAYHIQGIDDLFEGFIGLNNRRKQNIVDIASNHAGISYILPKYVALFKEHHSESRFKIRNLSKDEGIKRLMNDEIDLFIYPIPKDQIPYELEFIPIVTYKPILLTKKNHPLARKKIVKMEDIAKYELVRIDPKLITLPAFEELLKIHKIHSTIEFESSDWEILKKFVKNNIGVAMISDIVLEGDVSEEFASRSLTDYFPEMVYGLLVKKGRVFTGLTKKFINLLNSKKLLSAQNRGLK